MRFSPLRMKFIVVVAWMMLMTTEACMQGWTGKISLPGYRPRPTPAPKPIAKPVQNNGACKVEMKPSSENRYKRVNARGWGEFKTTDLGKALEYTSETRTEDVWRYSKTDRFPLTTEFTDSKNTKWRVSIMHRTDSCNLLVPVDNTAYLYFDGDDLNDRVGVGNNPDFVNLFFKYQQGSAFQSHGIKMITNGYQPKGGSNKSALDEWKGIMDYAIRFQHATADLVQAAADWKNAKKG